MKRALIMAATAFSITAVMVPVHAKKDRTPPAATLAGKAQSCIPIRSIRNTRVHGDNVIDFDMGGGRVYRNTLPQDCSGLGFEERFSYKTSLNQLCSTDIITVLRNPPGIGGPSCGLGEFQPVKLEKRR